VTVAADGAEAVTVAVKVTGWPFTTGLADNPTAVVVFAAFTVRLEGAELLVVKESEFGLYAAVTE